MKIQLTEWQVVIGDYTALKKNRDGGTLILKRGNDEIWVQLDHVNYDFVKKQITISKARRGMRISVLRVRETVPDSIFLMVYRNKAIIEEDLVQ